jgi:hypothetical protein
MQFKSRKLNISWRHYSCWKHTLSVTRGSCSHRMPAQWIDPCSTGGNLWHPRRKKITHQRHRSAKIYENSKFSSRHLDHVVWCHVISHHHKTTLYSHHRNKDDRVYSNGVHTSFKCVLCDSAWFIEIYPSWLKREMQCGKPNHNDTALTLSHCTNIIILHYH